MSNYKRTVVCLKDYTENGVLYWSSGKVYGLGVYKHNTWDIETNQGDKHKVGDGCPLEDFYTAFALTNKITLTDAVILAFNNGYFTEEKIRQGNLLDLENADLDDESEYESICEDIEAEIEDLITSGRDPERAKKYLEDILPICEYDGYNAFLPVLSEWIATVYKGNIIKNLIMDCQSYTKYRPNETTGGIFVSWRRKEELPTGA